MRSGPLFAWSVPLAPETEPHETLSRFPYLSISFVLVLRYAPRVLVEARHRGSILSKLRTMLPPSVDPDVRRLDGDDLIPCPRCHGWMLPLDGFDVDDATGSMFDDEESTGWHRQYILDPIFDFFANLLNLQTRRKKVERLQADLLPNFPNILICPRCFTVKQPR